jgi:hypothetical protein
MSFDIFIQLFERGNARGAEAEGILGTLRPFFVGKPQDGHVLVKTRDGEADIYGIDEAEWGLMVNHASGRAIWDLLFELASKFSVAIMPVGCPTCVTSREALAHLPEGLRAGARVVSTAADLLAAVNGAETRRLFEPR